MKREIDMIKIKQENIVPLLDVKYVRVFDLQYAPGKHYFDVSRNARETLVASMTDTEFRKQTPSAVTCAVICADDSHEARLLLFREYRYPVGRFLLSPPAGLIDPEDKNAPEGAAFSAAKRELFEETGLRFGNGDSMHLINPLLFSSPGLTDESNAMVCIIKNDFNDTELTQAGAVGSECFDGFQLLTKEEALRVLREGRDNNGFFYSTYTWIVLMYFVSGMWKD